MDQLKKEILVFIENKNSKIYPSILSSNKEYISYLNELYPSIKNINEKLYLLKNNLSEQDIICEKGNKRRFISFNKGYGVGCKKNCHCAIQSMSMKIKNKDEIWKIKRYERIKETNLKKHGVLNILILDEIKEKIKNTNLQRYGTDNPLKNNEIKNKIKNTNIEKYGVDNVFKSEQIKHKIKDIIKNKYGVDSYSRIHFNKSAFELITNKDLLIKEYVKNKKSSVELAKSYGISQTTISFYLRKYNIGRQFFSSSKEEKEIFEYVSGFGFFEKNNKKILHRLEIDIYEPNKKIGIEFCGLYWHSNLYKKDFYHMKKAEICSKNNIKLITIFSNEWETNREKIKNFLYFIFNNMEEKLYQDEIGKQKIIVDRKWGDADFLINHGYQISKYNSFKKWGIINNFKDLEEWSNHEYYICDCGYIEYEKRN